jgi:hypothetical protein
VRAVCRAQTGDAAAAEEVVAAVSFFAQRLGAATRSLRSIASTCLEVVLTPSDSSAPTAVCTEPAHWLQQLAHSPLRLQLTATLAPLVARAMRREDSAEHLTVYLRFLRTSPPTATSCGYSNDAASHFLLRRPLLAAHLLRPAASGGPAAPELAAELSITFCHNLQRTSAQPGTPEHVTVQQGAVELVCLLSRAAAGNSTTTSGRTEEQWQANYMTLLQCLLDEQVAGASRPLGADAALRLATAAEATVGARALRTAGVRETATAAQLAAVAGAPAVAREVFVAAMEGVAGAIQRCGVPPELHQGE